jgi:hypothetical protein
LLPIEHHIPSLANGLIDVYLAQCAYFKTKNVSTEFIHFVEEIATRGSRVMDLRRCPGTSPLSIDLVPILASLAHNTYIKTLIVSKLKIPRGKLQISRVLKYNKTIQILVLRGLGGALDFGEFGESFLFNRDNMVQILDVSENTTNTTAFETFTRGLSALDHSLKFLLMSKCKLSETELQLLFDALGNSTVASELEQLDLSKNKFGKNGSIALSNWLLHSKQSKLK